jgi:hypothetical protein
VRIGFRGRFLSLVTTAKSFTGKRTGGGLSSALRGDDGRHHFRLRFADQGYRHHIGVMKLFEDGKLRLDDPVNRLLTGISGRKVRYYGP